MRSLGDSIQHITSSFPTYGSLSTGCRICYSEDFHLHMDYMPRTLDEIIEGDARYHEENPDAL